MGSAPPAGVDAQPAPKTAVIRTRGEAGLAAPPVSVEVHLTGGVPQFSLVGLPATAVRESRSRVRSAILNSGFAWPDDRITVNLAPADLPKAGGRYDLAIAIGILLADRTIRGVSLDNIEFVGELGLTGQIRAVGRVLPAVVACTQSTRTLCIAEGDLAEAALARDGEIVAVESLKQLVDLLNFDRLEPAALTSPGPLDDSFNTSDLADVQGQAMARRALEIAAAGALNILMIGPPGSGKTMLAARMPGILPRMSQAEALESACIHSLSAAGVDVTRFWQRPFRSPHHSASSAALVGGGSKPSPGEISLAHNGVLFLDELPEFSRHTLDQLREPLESGVVHIARAAHRMSFPAGCQLVAAMNPCPCGWAGDPSGRCSCTPEVIVRYRNRVSGPLLDRIDLHLHVPTVDAAMLLRNVPGGETSREVLERVVNARARQLRDRGALNRDASARMLLNEDALSTEAREFLIETVEGLDLSARSQHRVLRVARTVADLADSARVEVAHVAEAAGLRCFDRASNDAAPQVTRTRATGA